VSQPTCGEHLKILSRAGASYRLIEHPPEGRTEVVGALERSIALAGQDYLRLAQPRIARSSWPAEPRGSAQQA
jgi:hypothetical protein